MRILASDGMEKNAVAALRAQGHEVVEQFYEPAELAEQVKNFDVLVVRSATKVRVPIIDAACETGKLKLIIRGGVGIDNIDHKYAEEKGIKVISFNGILTSAAILTHNATDNYAAGEMAGEALAQAMGGKGKYVVLGAAEGVQNNRDRSEGCIAYITENYPDMELIASDYMDNDMSVATSMINDWITANPDLGGIFTNNETGTLAAATVFQERDKGGQTAHVGFDATVQTVAQITDGITDSIISQQPFKMGYLSVENCVALLNGEEVPEPIDTGALLVTTENADSEEVNAIITPGS